MQEEEEEREERGKRPIRKRFIIVIDFMENDQLILK